MMQSVRMLGAVAIGAIVLSGAYAATVKDNSIHIRADDDSDDGRTVRHIVNGDRGEFLLRDDARTISASWRGEFELDETGNALGAMGRSFEIEIEDDDGVQKLEFEESRGEIERTYRRNGSKQKSSAETDAAADALFITFLRASGVKAEERVKAIHKEGGAGAVLDEFEYLEGDHSVRRYATALAENADLSADELTRLAGIVETMESDHDIRLALTAILEKQTIPASVTPALLSAAQKVESDHDLRLILEALAGQKMTDEALELALGVYEGIESDHDLRKAAEALLSNDGLSDAQTARLLSAAASRIESDHDMRLILTETSAMTHEPAIAEAWLAGFDALESSHDQRLALTEAADLGDHTSDFWKALIDRTEAIESSHDQRLALQTIAVHIERNEELLDAYRDAVGRIASDHERKLALDAIGE